MHFFKFLVLVFGVCLVFTKAETEIKDEEQFMQDEVEEGLKEDTEEEPKMLPEEDSEEDTPKKVILRSLYLTMKVPTHHNFYFFRTSYCFRRGCFGKKYAFNSVRDKVGFMDIGISSFCMEQDEFKVSKTRNSDFVHKSQISQNLNPEY